MCHCPQFCPLDAGDVLFLGTGIPQFSSKVPVLVAVLGMIFPLLWAYLVHKVKASPNMGVHTVALGGSFFPMVPTLLSVFFVQAYKLSACALK